MLLWSNEFELCDEVVWGSHLCQDVVNAAETVSKMYISFTCMIIQEDSLRLVTMKAWNFIIPNYVNTSYDGTSKTCSNTLPML
jgi:hypothetical protein